GLGFLQKPDDLLFRKALLHVRLLLRKRTLLDSGWPCLQGAGQPHNTARRNDLVLDEHLATVCTLRDGKIAAIETYLSDLPGMNAFFARD
ncbi:hypothetical protein QZM03_28475, partial [Burkholderia multivorans]|nr:hypothetical protein [Burkholderia multivorans]